MKNSLPLQSDLETISAYLDGEVTPEEKRMFAERLKYEKELQELYERLSRTRAILRARPLLRAPRNYIVKPQMVQQKKSVWNVFVNRNRLFQTASAVLSIVFGIWFCLNILLINQQKGLPMLSAPAPVYESAPQVSNPEAGAEEPPLLNREASTPANEPRLMAVPTNALNLEAPYPSIPESGGLGSGEITSTQVITPTPLMKSFSAATEIPPMSDQSSAMTATLPETYPAAIQAGQPENAQPGNRITLSGSDALESQQTESNPGWLLLQVVLAVLTILFGGLTFYFYKQREKIS